MKTLSYQSTTLVQWQKLTRTVEDLFSLTITMTSGCNSKWRLGFEWCYVMSTVKKKGLTQTDKVTDEKGFDHD
ncbi:MAG: hypothetical protein HRT37_25410 [Alteromonadaceae bacterium]|nr:hypothetical protein [Alteromonadaceae bacterium]